LHATGPGRLAPRTSRAHQWRLKWQNASTSNTGFEPTSKRKRGYPSETRVKRGLRMVNGRKELLEKLGRKDLCPCGSGRRFQAVLPAHRALRRLGARRLSSVND
jgi:hypothetical protein